ncbi:MAG: response regulator [bacterium]|nr:response regulator [bacterium]
MNKRILIVEDSQFFIVIMKSLLERTGSVIWTAKNGDEALEIIKNNPPDLVLMDLYMAGMDGAECCRKIKSNFATKDLPVIMVTAAGQGENIERCHEAGCDDYVTKPVDKIKLLGKVKKYLDLPLREHKRAPICVPATYYCDNEEYSGIIFSISEGGLYIKGEMILDNGSHLKIIFDIMHIAKQVELEGEVVWNTEEREHIPLNIGPGFGVRLTSIDEKGAAAIKEYVDCGDYLI